MDGQSTASTGSEGASMGPGGRRKARRASLPTAPSVLGRLRGSGAVTSQHRTRKKESYKRNERLTWGIWFTLPFSLSQRGFPEI
jgi:hypothetical protein